MPLLELHSSSLFGPVGEDALLVALHDLLVRPSRRRGAALLPQQRREAVLALKQVDEFKISSTERLTYISFTDQRLEQHLPDYVNLIPELDEHYLVFHNVNFLLLLDTATARCQV